MEPTTNTTRLVSDAVLDYVSDMSLVEVVEDIVDQNELDDSLTVPLLRALNELAEGKRSLADLPAMLKEVGVPQEAVSLVAADFAGNLLLPIAPAIGDVEGAIRSWGGDPAKFADVERVDLPEYSAEGFIHQTIGNLTASVSDDNERERLEFLLGSYARHMHSRDETLQSLMRAKKVGGLEWPVDEAARVLNAFDNAVKIAPAGLFAAPAPSPAVIPSAVSRPPTLPPKPLPKPIVTAPSPSVAGATSLSTGRQVPPAKQGENQRELDQEMAELLVAADQAASKPLSAPPLRQLLPTSPSKGEEVQTNNPLLSKEGSGVVGTVSTLEKEIADLLEAADHAELKVHNAKAKQVEAAAAPSGVDRPTGEPILTGVQKVIADLVDSAGLKDEETKKRLERIVDSRMRDVRDAYATRAELEKPVKAGGVGLSGRALVDVMERIEAAFDARQSETDARASREKTEMIQKNLSRAGAEDSVRAKEEQLLARRYAELTGKAPTEPVGSLAVRTSVAISAEQSVSRAAARLDKGKVERAVEAAKPQRVTPPSQGGVGGGGGRPQMADVTPPRRLTGPVDELGSLTLTEFRRLSKDPKSAATKVIDKVDLLGEQGYDQRVAGIRAWRESPLNRWYAACAREALSRGVGVPVLLEEKRKAGEETPTEAEVGAILSLNGQLRF